MPKQEQHPIAERMPRKVFYAVGFGLMSLLTLVMLAFPEQHQPLQQLSFFVLLMQIFLFPRVWLNQRLGGSLLWAMLLALAGFGAFWAIGWLVGDLLGGYHLNWPGVNLVLVGIFELGYRMHRRMFRP